MKKELKNTNKRKWVAGGLLFFGGVTLLTTAFATYIVGVNRTNQNLDTNVTVDGTVNELVKLTVELTDNSVHIGEKCDKGDDEIIGNPDGKATDFQITGTITVEVGKAYLDKYALNDVTFAFDYTKTEDKYKTNNNKVSVTSTTDGVHEVEDYTYIDVLASSTLTLPTTTETGNEGGWAIINHDATVSYVMENKDITLFTWGTFFEGKSPATYYNDRYKDSDDSITDSAEDLAKITKEMEDLEAAFTGGTIAIKASLNTTSK